VSEELGETPVLVIVGRIESIHSERSGQRQQKITRDGVDGLSSGKGPPARPALVSTTKGVSVNARFGMKRKVALGVTALVAVAATAVPGSASALTAKAGGFSDHWGVITRTPSALPSSP
jgi:hypothetical protein